jgi:PhnB protein
MTKINLNAYLMFDGNCREAMTFYQSLFGGTLKSMTFGEVDDSCPKAMRDSIMHSSLTTEELVLLGSDNPEPKPLGSGNISLALNGSDEQRLTQIFNKLSEEGKIVIPLERQMWGDLFGVVSDRFGIDWMVNIGSVEAEDQ